MNNSLMYWITIGLFLQLIAMYLLPALYRFYERKEDPEAMEEANKILNVSEVISIITWVPFINWLLCFLFVYLIVSLYLEAKLLIIRLYLLKRKINNPKAKMDIQKIINELNDKRKKTNKS